MTGPAGLGAVPDALGKLPPQGPEAPQPGRVHPVESSVETSCQADRNLIWDGNQPMERGRRKTKPKGVKQLVFLGLKLMQDSIARITIM